MSAEAEHRLVDLDTSRPIWDRFFMVAPLVIVGSREADGSYDLAPKHMVTALSWENHFGFVCTPQHGTYQNIVRDGVFTVSFPHPRQVVEASLAAAPRCDENTKPSLVALPTRPARVVEGVLLSEGYLFLECRLERIIDGFGINSLIAGRVVAAQVAEPALRMVDRDDHDLIAQSPLLAYLPPGRYATIELSQSFPFHAGYRRGDEQRS